MGLSISQQFLIEAERAVGPDNCFRWHGVGVALGLTQTESSQAMQSLSDRKLVLLLLEGEARLLDAGRQLAGRLRTKVAGRDVRIGSGKGRRSGRDLIRPEK